MSLFDDFLAYEFCVLGEAEVQCPLCLTMLKLQVDEPCGEVAYQCAECNGVFEVDWALEQISYCVPEELDNT